MTRKQILEIYCTGVEAVIHLVEKLILIIAELIKENQALKEKLTSLKTDSTNSHKPPSSDSLNKKTIGNKPERGSSGKKPGGQKGHLGKTRPKVLSAEVTDTIPHKPENCEQCGTSFSDDSPTTLVETRQVWDIPPIKPIDNYLCMETGEKGQQAVLPL